MQTVAGALLETQAQDGSLDNAAQRKANRIRWLKLNFTVKAARLQTLKRQKYQHLQEEALLKARGLLKNWENGVVVLTEDLYRLAAGEREAAELMNYTPEALALRFSLRNDPNVLEAVRQLWQIEMPRDGLGCIDQRGYAGVFRRIAKSLDAKAFKKKQKVDKLLHEEWKRDSKGEATMSFANFFDSIFELADLWCETIDADDYLVFLERLRDRISHVHHGKRTFKPMSKVGAFDADSDDDEEEEEEPSDAESDDDKPAKVTPTSPQPRLLIAKAVRPVDQQHPPTTTNTLRKVTRVAMANNKVPRPKDVTTVKQPITTPSTATVVASQTPMAVPTVRPTTPSHDTVAPLVRQGTIMPATPSRQRRASVVTTIQFLQDGFVRSVSESMPNNTAEGSTVPHASTAGLSQVVAAALAANTMRDARLRPSLASAAAAALARNRQPTQSENTSRPSTPPAPVSGSGPSQVITNPTASERKRVITVSTAKHAVLKSVVFTTRKVGISSQDNSPLDETSQDMLMQRQESNDVFRNSSSSNERDEEIDLNNSIFETDERDSPTEAPAPSTGNYNAKPRGPVGGASASSPFANAVAIRIRTGSLFDVDNSSGPLKRSTTMQKKGIRIGLGKTAGVLAKQIRGGNLAPLTESHTINATSIVGREGAMQSIQRPSTLTAIPFGAPTAIKTFTGSPSTGGVDFSSSVVTSNYVVEKSSVIGSQGPRAPTILGSNPTRKSPSTTKAGTASQSPSSGIHGTRALAEETIVSREPTTTREPPKAKKSMVTIVHKPLAQQSESTSQVPHRYIGHALHGTRPHDQSPAQDGDGRPEGYPEHALQIKAALERQLRDPLAHSVARRERHYDHTDPDAMIKDPQSTPQYIQQHGLTIQSLYRNPEPLHHVYMDPIATPWDTFDDDDDLRDDTSNIPSSITSLLQPENAMEALAKVINKREATYSAGASRDRTSTPSSVSSERQRSRPEQDIRVDADDFRDESQSDVLQTRRPRSRLLTVSHLGGKSVDLGATSGRRFMRRRSRDESNEDYDDWPKSASVPVLPTVSPLQLEIASSLSIPSRQRKRTTSPQGGDGSTPLIKLPVRGHSRDVASFDDLELRGELAIDPSQSPPRSLLPGASRPSPIKLICTCSRNRDPTSGENDSESHSWPPPVFRLDKARPDDDNVDGSASCPTCQRRLLVPDATIILNAKHEVYLEPQSKEQDILALVSRATPTRSEMMRRRHRYIRGKPG